MSVLGLGNDLVAVARIARLLESHPERFLERCFRPDEVALADSRRGDARTAALAARWAAKEACIKALGAGAASVPYRDVEVVRSPDGPVSLRLHGEAARLLERMGGRGTRVSLSHDGGLALATVIIEG